jgi:hypothetical protein
MHAEETIGLALWQWAKHFIDSVGEKFNVATSSRFAVNNIACVSNLAATRAELTA